MRISQSDAADMFDLPCVTFYVCDGRKECGKPSCSDWDDDSACHHTADISHALYDAHRPELFTRYSAVREEGASIICVEPIRG